MWKARTSWAVFLILGSGCDRSSLQQRQAQSDNPDNPMAAQSPPVALVVACSSEKKTWMEAAVKEFNGTRSRTPSGRPVNVDLRVAGSGDAAQDIATGVLKAHVFTPASAAYLTLLNEQWQAHGNPRAVVGPGEPLVLSPLVIAMWRPMAEALGWPKKELGWRDILKVSQSPKGWGSLKHPKWGDFKLGHTHPESSNSGLLSILAEAYAATGKRRQLVAADLQSPKTRKTMAAIEASIVHYGKSTNLFADKMLERGPGYMSAAVLYENLVIDAYRRPSDMPLVAIYPLEGTFWSDHPYATLEADWVGAEEKAAAKVLLAFLKSKPQQQAALALGFRPGDSSIPIAAPIDADHGVDPKQPQTLLEVPDGPMLTALLAMWRDVKKPAEVMFVFDRSGSMQGLPLLQAKAGAITFLKALGTRDAVSTVLFNDQVGTVEAPSREGIKKGLSAIVSTFADGGTALYDAVAQAYDLMKARAAKEKGSIKALVVMTDGVDEDSKLALPVLLGRFSGEVAPVKIFTIAYGANADDRILTQISAATQATSVKGKQENIVQIYRDLSAFF